jgi:dihydrofolate reductase
MTLALIAAVARNGVIGRDQQLPWRLPEDLKRFKAVTMGHTLLMGRATFDSIGRALPGRRTIVVTRQPGWTAPGVEVAHSIEAALALAATPPAQETSGNRESGGALVFIAGGGDIYRQALDRADWLYLTVVDQDVEGDTRFPEFDRTRYREVWREDHPDGPVPFSFVTLERRG